MSVIAGPGQRHTGGPAARASGVPPPSLSVDDLDRLERPVLNLADGHVLDADVAVVVETPLAKGPLVEISRGQTGPGDLCAVLLADLLDCFEGDLSRFVPVDGVCLRLSELL